jgi:hypothetical protein
VNAFLHVRRALVPANTIAPLALTAGPSRTTIKMAMGRVAMNLHNAILWATNAMFVAVISVGKGK